MWTVIVPYFDEEALLTRVLRCLEKCQECCNNITEVIVACNGSNIPNSESRKFPLVFLDASQKTGSYFARNRAVEKASGEFIAFTDVDCLPKEDWLLDAPNKKSITYGQIRVFSENYTIWSIVDRCFAFNQKYYVKNGMGVTANCLVSKEDFLEIGFFNEKFSGSDVVFARKAHSLGYNIVYDSKKIVGHPSRDTYNDLITKSRRVFQGKLENGFPKFRLIISYLIPPRIIFVKKDEVRFVEHFLGSILYYFLRLKTVTWQSML